MVFKSTGSISRFQCKNRFWKICTESRDIGQNVSNFTGLVWKADFGQFFGIILGLVAYFSKPIFALKPWDWASRFEYINPIIRMIFFSPIKGSDIFLKFRAPKLNPLKNKKNLNGAVWEYRFFNSQNWKLCKRGTILFSLSLSWTRKLVWTTTHPTNRDFSKASRHSRRLRFGI